MGGETFGLRLVEVRNKGLPFDEVWAARLGPDFVEPRYEPFQLWPVASYDNISADDLVWGLIAAALVPTSTHLELRFRKKHKKYRPSQEILEEVIVEVIHLGFHSMEISDHQCEVTKREFGIAFSLFSLEEMARVYANT